MRYPSIRRRVAGCISASILLAVIPTAASGLRAQEPPPVPIPAPTPTPAPAPTPTPAPTPGTQTPGTQAPGTQAPADTPPPEGRPRRSGQPRAARATAFKVGTVHPVSSPSFEDGVVLVVGNRIQAVGKASEITIPPGAEVVELPDAHVYPGLVDAGTTAFLEGPQLADTGTNAGTTLELSLDPHHQDGRKLAAAGITTAFVGNVAEVTWRGLGVVIRPRADGFDVLPEQRRAAVQSRMTSGAAVMHPIERARFLRAIGQAFDGLDAHEKARADHRKALADYEKQWKEYVDWHAAKNGKKPADANPEGTTPAGPTPTGAPRPNPANPATPEAGGGTPGSPATPPEGEGRRRRPGGNPEGGPGGGPGGRPAGGPANNPTGRPGAGQPGTGGPGGRPTGAPAAQGTPAAAPAAEAPKRPTYPKEPAEDLAKDALLEIKQGKLPLRAEAHRAEEIRAALAMAAEHQIPRLILEGGAEAGALAEAIAESGTPVVLTPAQYRGRLGPDHDLDAELAGRLAKAGVTVAIASGDARTARFLPLLAAEAVAQGMPEATAVRAITLTAAEVLGLGRLTGSLEAGKFADLVFVSAPLLRSDAQILRVVGSGRTLFESKKP